MVFATRCAGNLGDLFVTVGRNVQTRVLPVGMKVEGQANGFLARDGHFHHVQVLYFEVGVFLENVV